MTAVELAGLIDGLDEAEYHRHPALSSSGAKKLLPPSCPALYRHERDNPPASTTAFDIGHAAHAAILGVGAEVAVVDADNWMSKAAKEARAKAYEDGLTPLLAKEKAAVDAMTAAVRSHPDAARLLEDGKPERSLFWTDWTTGVQRRARLDWLTLHDDGTATIADLKTAACAEPGKYAKAVADYGYALSAAWYIDAVQALGLAEQVRFVHIVVEKTAPHLVGVYELGEEWLTIGRQQVAQALTTFAACEAADVWPSYCTGVELLRPPSWLLRQYEGGAW